MERGDVACGLIALIVIVAGLSIMWWQFDESNEEFDRLNDPNESLDYLGGGLYACSNCNWTGYAGLMVFHDEGFLHDPDYYCPECGHEIDVRGE